jgi:hypothetical protein
MLCGTDVLGQTQIVIIVDYVLDWNVCKMNFVKYLQVI